MGQFYRVMHFAFLPSQRARSIKALAQIDNCYLQGKWPMASGYWPVASGYDQWPLLVATI